MIGALCEDRGASTHTFNKTEFSEIACGPEPPPVPLPQDTAAGGPGLEAAGVPLGWAASTAPRSSSSPRSRVRFLVGGVRVP